MDFYPLRIRSFEDFLGECDPARRVVRDDQEGIGLDRGLVFEHAVLGDAQAIKPGRDRADPADQDRTFERGYGRACR